jgi:hypothetical protein
MELASRLVDQRRARIAVPPLRASSGFWFGSGNMTISPEGEIFLSGRYRNRGDSRLGLEKGERGLELAIFRSEGGNFEKILSLTKADLSRPGSEVISIEGSTLCFANGGIELYFSAEKRADYPPGFEQLQKPGTGVWTIDRIMARSFDRLKEADPETVLRSTDPRFLHVKDPVVYRSRHGGWVMIFCSHPATWTSSNSGYALRPEDCENFGQPVYGFFRRGFTWDVAVSRITDALQVPPLGPFAGLSPLTLYFYDGAECMRPLEQNQSAVSRPRGYSCEEIGGLAFGWDAEFPALDRLSQNFPQFVSPYGTGSSRYVRTLCTDEGIYATWQQSQQDLSQPLVVNFLPGEEVERLLQETAKD